MSQCFPSWHPLPAETFADCVDKLMIGLSTDNVSGLGGREAKVAILVVVLAKKQQIGNLSLLFKSVC